MICSEWLARSQGDGFGRVLPYFAKYQIHWQNWGLYTCDANWSILWEDSTFDSHDPWFHDVLHPDGTPYDYREIELIKNFTFSQSSGDPLPGIELTDRWAKDRAWMYYVQGPMKGWAFMPSGMLKKEDMWKVKREDQKNWTAELSRLAQSGCDGLRIYIDFVSWEDGPEIFIQKLDHFLSLADSLGLSVIPVLMTDKDAKYPIEKIREYTHSLVHKFGRDTRIFCWDLYEHPGTMGVDENLARDVLLAMFRSARFEFPGQPLTATPAFMVKEAPDEPDYRRALIHGGTPAGWVNMTTAGQYNEDKFREQGIFDMKNLDDNPELRRTINGFHVTRKSTKRRIYYEIDGVRSVVGR